MISSSSESIRSRDNCLLVEFGFTNKKIRLLQHSSVQNFLAWPRTSDRRLSELTEINEVLIFFFIKIFSILSKFTKSTDPDGLCKGFSWTQILSEFFREPDFYSEMNKMNFVFISMKYICLPCSLERPKSTKSLFQNC